MIYSTTLLILIRPLILRVILNEVLGEGAFGIVRRAKLHDRSDEIAVKMLKGMC